MVLLSIFAGMVPTVMSQLIYSSLVMIWSQVWLILPLITINISLSARCFLANSIAFQPNASLRLKRRCSLWNEFMTINGEAALRIDDYYDPHT